MNRSVTRLRIKLRRQRRGQAAKRRSAVSKYAGFTTLAAIILPLFAAIFIISTTYFRVIRDLPQVSELEQAFDPETGFLATPTRFYDRSGTVLLAEMELPGIQRSYLPLSGEGQARIPAMLAQAVVAAAQQDFYQSPGFSLFPLDAKLHPTIAQELVYKLLLEGEPPGLARAIRERWLAAEAIDTYGHDRVLEWYLNSADFGNYAYGVEAAARTYFGRSAGDLNPAEAAMLAAISLAPEANPWDAPDTALRLQQILLKQMAADRLISVEEYRAAQETPVKVTDPVRLAAVKNGFTSQAVNAAVKITGYDRLMRGGLIVTTTLDAGLQQQLECVQAEVLAALQEADIAGEQPGGDCAAAGGLPLLPPAEKLPAGSLAVSSAVVDPGTGEVLAIAAEGGDVAQEYPAGTLITPFIYLGAFADGYSPASLVWDAPADWPAGQALQGDYRGPVSMRQALVADITSHLPRLINATGASELQELLASIRLSIAGRAEAGGDLPVVELDILKAASAYGVLSNGGILAGLTAPEGTSGPQPVWIHSIRDSRGNSLQLPEHRELAVFSPQLAYLATHVLADETLRSSNPDVAGVETGGRLALKAGRVSGGSGAWSAGYSPELAFAVHLAAGGNSIPVAVQPRWAAAALEAIYGYSLAGSNSAGRVMPQGMTRLEVCVPSGQLPDGDCPQTRPEVFINGNSPDEPDSLYSGAYINRETGNLATVFTPADRVERIAYLQVPPEYAGWGAQAGIKKMPVVYDAIPVIRPEADLHITSPAIAAAVRGRVKVTGTAATDGLAGWRVDVGSGFYPESWVQVGSGGSRAVREGLLAEWDTSGLAGVYIIRLSVIDDGGVVRTAYTQVSVGE